MLTLLSGDDVTLGEGSVNSPTFPKLPDISFVIDIRIYMKKQTIYKHLASHNNNNTKNNEQIISWSILHSIITDDKERKCVEAFESCNGARGWLHIFKLRKFYQLCTRILRPVINFMIIWTHTIYRLSKNAGLFKKDTYFDAKLLEIML